MPVDLLNLPNKLTDATVATEGLVPGQTPLRRPPGSEKWNTVQGVPINKNAKVPSDRKNFFFVEEGREKEVIKKQWQNQFKTPERYGLSESSTVSDVIKKFDQERPQNKIEWLKKKGIDINTTIKGAREKFDLSKLNPFAATDAEASSGRDLLAKQPRDLLGEQPQQLDTLKAGDFANQFMIGFGNEALMGFPLYAMEKFQGEQAVKNLESQNPVERFGRGLGTTAGLVAGLPKIAVTAGIKGAQLAGRLALGADKLKKINSFTKNVIKGAAGATAFEAMHAPDEEYSEKAITIPTAALFGGVVGGIADKAMPAIQRILAKKGLVKNDMIGGTPGLDKMNKMLAKSHEEPSNAVSMKIKSVADGFQAEFVDRFAPIRNLVEKVESFAGKFPVQYTNPKEQIDRVLGSQSIIDNYITRYADILKKAGNNVGPLKQMKIALRLQELANRKGPTGKPEFHVLPGEIKPREVPEMMNQLRNHLGPEEFTRLERVAKQHRALLGKMLGCLKESGFMDDLDYENVIKKNEFYTPFEVMDFMETEAAKFIKGTGFRAGVPGALKRLTGTSRDVLDPVEAEVRYIFKAVNAAEKNLTKRAVVDMASFNDDAAKLIKAGDDPIEGFKPIHLWKDGKKQTYMVEENLANAMDGLNQQSIDLMTKFMGKFSSALRMGATSLNTSFSIPNFFRDVFNAKVTAKALFDVNLGFRDIARGFVSVIRKDRWFKQWEKNGGGFSSLQQILRKSQTGLPNAEKMLNPSLSSKINSATNPLKFLADVSEVSELTTRLGVFRAALRQGKSMNGAIHAARNASIDFSRMGNTMQLANMWVPFLNARWQGSLNTLRAFKKNPKQFMMTASGIIGAPYLATYFNNTTRFPQVWDSIRDFEKENNFLFIWGDEKDADGKFTQVAKIPKGDIGRLLTNPLEEVLEYSRGTQPDFATTALQFLNDLSPIDFEDDGQLSPQTAFSSILPPPIKAGAESLSGVNFFTGRRIVPLNLENAPAQEQYTHKTAPMAVGIGKLLNISPMKVENSVGTLFGTFGRQVMDPFKAPQTIGKRFVGAFGNEEQQEQFEMLEDILATTETDKAKRFRAVRLAMQQSEGLPPIPSMRAQFVINQIGNDTKAVEDYLDLVEAQKNGENPLTRKLKRVSVKDRLRFIREWTSSMKTADEKLQFLRVLIQNKVLTQSSLEHIQ